MERFKLEDVRGNTIILQVLFRGRKKETLLNYLLEILLLFITMQMEHLTKFVILTEILQYLIGICIWKCEMEI